jgi:hypothetical protein
MVVSRCRLDVAGACAIASGRRYGSNESIAGDSWKTVDSWMTLDLMRLPLGILTGMGFLGGGPSQTRISLSISIFGHRNVIRLTHKKNLF